MSLPRAATFLLFPVLAACAADEPAGEPSDATSTGQVAPSDAPSSGEVASADGVPIHFEVRGSGEPALVLVHGWTNDRRIWGEHPATLSRSHRVVTLDLAGHGESGAERTAWTVGAFGDDVAAVVRHLDLERVVLVGFSMGAGVVLEAAQRIPERVAGVVFVDFLHDPDNPLPPVTAEQFEATFRANWGDTAFLRAFAFTPDAPDSLIRMFAATAPPEPREHWFPAMHEFFAWAEADLVPALQSVQAPIAAINTTSEPTNVEAMRRYVPSFTVDTMHGLGHAGILLQRTEDFDRRLLGIVQRFTTGAG